jgi:GNAT superfamily N-acetyltransferase
MNARLPGTALPASIRVGDADGILTLANANTTIGYCRYDQSGTVEYVFVNPTYRRKGYAKLMLSLVQDRLGTALQFEPPISPLGTRMVESYRRLHG